jgi:hypothetical protein
MTKTATVHAQQRWEYMELTRKTQAYLVAELSELGQIGWELVSVTKHRETRAGSGEAWFWTAFIKRPQAAHNAPITTQEKAAAPAEAGAIHRPARLEPSETSEEVDFAEVPAEKEAPVAPSAG